MKKHLNFSDELVRAWANSEPLRALCGYTRVVHEDEYTAAQASTACGNCARIANARGARIANTPSPDQVRASAANHLKPLPKPWKYTFISATTYRMEAPVNS